MRIDPHKKVREVAGEHIIIMQSPGKADMTKIVALNESALWLYEELKDKSFIASDVAKLLTGRYDVDGPTALRDAEEWVASMKREGVVVDE